MFPAVAKQGGIHNIISRKSQKCCEPRGGFIHKGDIHRNMTDISARPRPGSYLSHPDLTTTPEVQSTLSQYQNRGPLSGSHKADAVRVRTTIMSCSMTLPALECNLLLFGKPNMALEASVGHSMKVLTYRTSRHTRLGREIGSQIVAQSRLTSWFYHRAYIAKKK